jgi:hypothetical protein
MQKLHRFKAFSWWGSGVRLLFGHDGLIVWDRMQMKQG